MTAQTILVIGYGNTLRGDDGLGPAVAAAIRERGWPGVRSLAVPQLTPELAEVLAGCRAAIFVDARMDAAEAVTVIALDAASEERADTHGGDPRGLLALAERLYRRVPPAWLVAVAGQDFGLSEMLSAEARARAQAAEEVIAGIVESLEAE